MYHNVFTCGYKLLETSFGIFAKLSSWNKRFFSDSGGGAGSVEAGRRKGPGDFILKFVSL